MWLTAKVRWSFCLVWFNYRFDRHTYLLHQPNFIQRMKIKQIWIFSLFFIAGGAQAQSLNQKLQSAFGRLQADSQCRYAAVSLTVLDAKTGEQMFAVNQNMGLATASTLKTVTTITAFNILGKDFQYQTQFGYSGQYQY